MNWFLNRSTRTKLLLSFGLITALLAMIAGAAWWTLETVSVNQRLAIDLTTISDNFNKQRVSVLTMRQALKDTMIMLVPMFLVLALLIVWPQVALFVPSLVSPEFLK